MGTLISVSTTELTFDSRPAISLMSVLSKAAATTSIGNPKTRQDMSVVNTASVNETAYIVEPRQGHRDLRG